MADQLLRTKLLPPPGRVVLVKRARLHEQLDAGTRLPLTLIAAPAGAGKTSLLRSWRATLSGQSAPLAWVSLDDDDNDPVRFWRYAIGALSTCFPGLGDLGVATDLSDARALDAVITALLNTLADRPGRCLLVLDDYHVIDTPRIHETLSPFIERLPESLRVVMTTRVDPPLPLARWRARGQMAEIRVDDLRFTENEAAEMLRIETGAALSAQEVSALTARTEGWAAGLHLASLALHQRPDPGEFLRSFSGSHRYVAAYLVDEVLDLQSPDVQQFLLETSILSHLHAPLCDEVTSRGGSDKILRDLESANLFVTPIDDSGEWYRYHHLFADVLQLRLKQQSPDVVPVLHARAAAWYATNDLYTRAIDHALRAGDGAEAARLIRLAAPAHRRAGEAQLVQRWLAQAPVDIVRADPALSLIGAWSQMVAGPLSAVEAWLAPVDDHASVDDALRGEVAAVRAMVASFSGDVSRTISEAGTALRLLPDENAQLRGVVAMSLGQAHRFDGNLELAGDAYRQAVELGLSTDNLYAAIDSLADLGLVLLKLGRLRDASDAFQRADRELRARDAERQPVAGSLAVIWPELLREQNQLVEARAMIERGIALGHAGAKMDILITGHRGLASILWPLGAWDEAFAALHEARDLARQYGLDHTARGIDAREVQMWLARGDVAPALVWETRYEPEPELPGAVREAESLALARVRLASGDVESALHRIGVMRSAAEREQRFGDLIGILALESVAFDAAGQRDAALSSLVRGLRLAAPEGYVRALLDEGSAMLALLREAVARRVMPEYASRLLAEAGDADDSVDVHDDSPGHLTESLTERERTTLRLLAAGLSAPEIAGELYIAPSTVRSHLKSLYRKLDVHSRDQAVRRAHDLGLLGR